MNKALEAFRNGKFIIVTDDFDRENEGDLIAAAMLTTEAMMGFMVRHTSGVVCVALDAERARRLALPPMVAHSQDSKGTAFTVSVDFKAGITTGISASERAATVRGLADPHSHASEFQRPGHIFPLISNPMGLAGRRGHTEAGIVLCELAGLPTAAVLSELVNDDGSMMRGNQLSEFAVLHGIPLISISELANLERPNLRNDFLLDVAAESTLPRQGGTWKIEVITGIDGDENVLLTLGHTQVDDDYFPLVRIHSECFTGDVLGSTRCECGPQLHSALSKIEEEGRGALIYLRGHEGRGIGLIEKIRAYALQDNGLDTVDANLALGHEIDERKWHDAVELLKYLQFQRIRLLTNNPAKVAALEDSGIEVDIVALIAGQNELNARYLASKRDRLGHIIPSDLELFGKEKTR